LHQHHQALDGATDYLFDADTFGAKMTEGFAWFTSNNEGYYNRFDYHKGMDISTLIMGSSHMEGTNLMYWNNTANLLENFLNEKVYNIGVSGHNFIHCAANLKAALQKYKPENYVAIETNSIKFNEKELNDVLEDSVKKIPAYDQGILAQLRKNNFLRLMYAQFFQNFLKKYVLKTAPANPFETPQNDGGLTLSKVLNKMSATVRENSSAKIIIAYHPFVSLNKDGSLKIEGDLEAVKIFSDLCKENGIYFIDMSERFLSEYQKDFTLPYGFFNTSVASGHMNKDGHRMFAEEIYKLMQKIERGEN